LVVIGTAGFVVHRAEYHQSFLASASSSSVSVLMVQSVAFLAFASSSSASASMVPLVVFLALAFSSSASALMVPSVPLLPDTLVLLALLLLLAPAAGGLVPLVLACGLLALLVAAWCCKTLQPLFLHLVGVLIMRLLSFFFAYGWCSCHG
jgi:hypothetical protein